MEPDAPRRIPAMTTVGTFLKKGTCSETLINVLDRACGNPLPDEERATGPLAGGIVSHGYQCGQLWGAALAGGAEAHRRHGAGAIGQAKAIVAARRLIEAFRVQNGHCDCFELTGLSEKTTGWQMLAKLLFKGGPTKCLGMSARYAPVALREIEAGLSEQDETDVPAAPVGCAAVMAHKLGASDLHTTMAAGLAGGIGLSGGACGALGAAIWITGVRSLQSGAAKVPYKSPEAAALIDRFLKCTNYEFECSTIVGRTFGGVADHAAHVCSGGCAKILDALASR